VKARNAFFYALLRCCSADRELGISYLPTHEVAANWSDSLGLKISSEIDKTHRGMSFAISPAQRS